jgi:pimeloyl-ACP methyl ester carboxylesterase
VLLHGNGSMIQDFESGGLLAMAAKKYRVIAFDRPGFGHSERPRATIWTPEAQADLIHAALSMIGISRVIVLGHSWGASVATALALKYPQDVGGLVLTSGYYYPSVRADVVLASGPAVPVRRRDALHACPDPRPDDVASRAAAQDFWARVNAAELRALPEGDGAASITNPRHRSRVGADDPDAFSMRGDYAGLKMPLVIIAGDHDRLIEIDNQSARLHDDVTPSTFHRLRGVGHMVHQTAPAAVMSAIDEAAAAGSEPQRDEVLPRAA